MRVGIGAALQEQPHQLNIPLLNGHAEHAARGSRRGGIRVVTALEQRHEHLPRHSFSIANQPDGQGINLPLDRAEPARIRPALHEPEHQVRTPQRDGTLQRRRPVGRGRGIDIRPCRQQLIHARQDLRCIGNIASEQGGDEPAARFLLTSVRRIAVIKEELLQRQAARRSLTKRRIPAAGIQGIGPLLHQHRDHLLLPAHHGTGQRGLAIDIP